MLKLIMGDIRFGPVRLHRDAGKEGRCG